MFFESWIDTGNLKNLESAVSIRNDKVKQIQNVAQILKCPYSRVDYLSVRAWLAQIALALRLVIEAPGDWLMDLRRVLQKHSDKSERGASLIEYCILVAMIAMVTLGAVRTFGDRLTRGDNTGNHKINYASIEEAVSAAGNYTP